MKLTAMSRLFLLLGLCSSVHAGTATISVSSSQQKIQGFGAANIIPWRPDMSSKEVQQAFGTGDGQLGFSILRVRVPSASSEFSRNVATAKAAYNLGAKIIGTPWSPPASMKTNSNAVGGSLKTDQYAAYAAHLKSFANYMSSQGAPVYAVSVQNEPDITVTYESCDWTPAQLVTFMKNNAASIGVKVFASESFHYNKAYTDPILNDATARNNLAFLGGHIYGSGLTTYPLATTHGKEFWMTEHLITETAWSDTMKVVKEMHDCMVAGMSAYVWWYIIRNYGPMAEDGSGPTQRGYAMAQFARFVRPAYVRVTATANPATNVYVTAYKDSSSTKIVIVAINMQSSGVSQTFALSGGSASAFTPYVTTSSDRTAKKSAVSTSGGSFTYTLSGSSITTFVSSSASSSSSSSTPPTSPSSTAATPKPPTTPPTTSSSCSSSVALWGDCKDHPKCCASGKCYQANQWYAQCRTSCGVAGWTCSVLG